VCSRGGSTTAPCLCAAVLVVPVLRVRSTPHPYISTHHIYIYIFLWLFVFCIYKLDRCTRGPLAPDHQTVPFLFQKQSEEGERKRKKKPLRSVGEGEGRLLCTCSSGGRTEEAAAQDERRSSSPTTHTISVDQIKTTRITAEEGETIPAGTGRHLFVCTHTDSFLVSWSTGWARRPEPGGREGRASQ
jgi:hypothetical protein